MLSRRQILLPLALGVPAAAIGAAAVEAPPLLKGPVPAAPIRDWITASDFPAETLKSATVVGPANFALTISEKGRVIRCIVERSSGSKQLDDTACYIFEQRGRFHAAVDSVGKPAIGVYRVDALWAVSSRSAAPTIPLVEMAVALQKMPQPLSDPAYVEIAVSVDEAGKVDGCVPAEALSWAGLPIADRQQAALVLGGVPCAQALKTLKLEPAKTDKGKAVRSVQTATVLFTADVPALVASLTPKPDAQAAQATASAAPPTPLVDPDAILVEGRNITGKITRPEAVVPYRGVYPFRDLFVIGRDVVLLEAEGDKFYRATLESPCFGTSSMMKTLDPAPTRPDDPLPPPKLIIDDPALGSVVEAAQAGPIPEGLAFVTHSDGTFDKDSWFIARVIDEADGNMHVRRCWMISLVESQPPKGWKRSSRPVKPIRQPPLLAARAPVTAPDGGRVYPADWVERPSQDQFDRMAGGRPGSGWIMCQTIAGNKVRNCRTTGESPDGSGVANQIKLASASFRIRPPMVGGRPAVGAWVAIGFDFTPVAKRRTTLSCDPSSRLDPC